jgi:hypothetical protein
VVKRFFLLPGAYLIALAALACGGASTNSPSSGGKAGAAASAGMSSGGGAGKGGEAAGGSEAASSSGGTGIHLGGAACQVEKAAACRALVDPFVEVLLGDTGYRYGESCGGACGKQEVPALSSGLESNNASYLAACDAGSSANITLTPTDHPAEVTLCKEEPAACRSYRVDDWKKESTPLREGVMELKGTATATSLDDPSASPLELTLHFVICYP